MSSSCPDRFLFSSQFPEHGAADDQDCAEKLHRRHGLMQQQKADVPYIAAISLINTGLAYLLYFSGLQKLSGQSVALISYIDPVSTLFFSAVLLNERLSPLQVVGAVMILGGAILAETRKS